jgi:circadian clock protein KaiA
LSGQLTIAVLADSVELRPLLGQFLSEEFFNLQYFTDRSEFLAQVETSNRQLDCLLFCSEQQLLPVINHLYERSIILPVVIMHRLTVERSIGPETLATSNTDIASSYIYQPSEVILAISEIAEIGMAIDKAIAKFLNLKPIMPASEDSQSTTNIESEKHASEPNLLQQQNRLSRKLNERLGYLAVYYKRNPRQFFRHLNPEQRQELLELLKSQYRDIVLEYFADAAELNVKIDEFVSLAFFKDLAVSEIVKIHMELIEEFSDQLKLEGRSEEILLDYRLTLIDIIAHLCEMYRRSIPREM